jgi:hypothetical protein
MYRDINPTATCVNVSVSENSPRNTSEFGKELTFATKHSVFSIAESREGLRAAHRNLAFHLPYFSVSVVLKTPTYQRRKQQSNQPSLVAGAAFSSPFLEEVL